jgi:hypothetical protein
VYVEGSFFPTSSPTPVGGIFDVGYSNRVRWNLSVVLIFTRDGEHFFMCFLAFLISSFDHVLFSSVAHFFIGSLFLGEFNFLSFLYILVISSLSDM